MTSYTTKLCAPLFTALYEALFCSDGVEYIPLDMGLCCFQVGDFEIVVVDQLNTGLLMEEFLVSISCDGIEEKIKNTFGSIHELIGTFKEMSKSINQVRCILEIAKLNYEANMKNKSESRLDGETLQDCLGLNDLHFTSFFLKRY